MTGAQEGLTECQPAAEFGSNWKRSSQMFPPVHLEPHGLSQKGC